MQYVPRDEEGISGTVRSIRRRRTPKRQCIVHVRMRVRACMYVRMYVHVRLYVYVYVYMYMYMCICVYVYVYIYLAEKAKKQALGRPAAKAKAYAKAKAAEVAIPDADDNDSSSMEEGFVMGYAKSRDGHFVRRKEGHGSAAGAATGAGASNKVKVGEVLKAIEKANQKDGVDFEEEVAAKDEENADGKGDDAKGDDGESDDGKHCLDFPVNMYVFHDGAFIRNPHVN